MDLHYLGSLIRIRIRVKIKKFSSFRGSKWSHGRPWMRKRNRIVSSVPDPDLDSDWNRALDPDWNPVLDPDWNLDLDPDLNPVLDLDLTPVPDPAIRGGGH
jgi:hypothetical protein